MKTSFETKGKIKNLSNESKDNSSQVKVLHKTVKENFSGKKILIEIWVYTYTQKVYMKNIQSDKFLENIKNIL